MDTVYNVSIGGKTLPLKHLDKVFDPPTTTKAQIIEYYQQTAPLIIPHIKNKPFSMIHFPDGTQGKNFYQKRKPANAPQWLESIRLPTSSSEDGIEWCLVNNTASIIYMANRSVVEMHTFFSRIPTLNTPDIAVIDLDPSGASGFNDARIVAQAFGTLISELDLFSVAKTSGGSGIHIYIPTKSADFGQIQTFLNALCRIVESTYPDLATTERTVGKRGDRVYLDAVQNGYGKTIASPYSLRARPGMPFSAPLMWSELENDNLSPTDFNINNFSQRIEKVGDPFRDFYQKAQNLPKL